MNKSKLTLGIVAMLLLLASCTEKQEHVQDDGIINTFEECKSAEYPVSLSYPAKCTMDGKVFVQKIQTETSKIIHSNKGDLVLGYKDGKAILTGTLQRSTPCVDWKVRMTEYSDRSKLELEIHDSGKDSVCIQVLGEPQEIGISAASSEETNYIVTLEEDTIFEGKI